MKSIKIFLLILTAALIFSLAACGSKTAGTSAAAETAASSAAEGSAAEQLADLDKQGFTVGSISYSDGAATANYTNRDHTEFRQVVCTMTLKQCGALLTLNNTAEDYDRQCREVLSACQDLKIITPVLPDASAYENFAGKTVGEMEEEGLDFSDFNEDAAGNPVVDLYVYPDDDTTYKVRVYPEGIEKGRTYDDDAVRALVVGKIVFWEFV